MQDYVFWIKGIYHSEKDLFSFLVFADPDSSTDYLDFLASLRKNLESPKTLKDTEIIIKDLLSHKEETIREIGIILRRAADLAWVDYLSETSIDDN